MGFFSDRPPPPPPEPPVKAATPAWMRPDDGEIPRSVAAPRVLAREPGAWLTLQRIDVYTQGIEYVLRFDLRREPGLSAERASEVDAMLNPRRESRGSSFGQVRVGVELSDGARTEIESGAPSFRHDDLTTAPTAPALRFRDGQGSRNGDHWRFVVHVWQWPFPPPGPLTLHFQMETIGIPEGSVELDTTEFHDARAEVVVLSATD